MLSVSEIASDFDIHKPISLKKNIFNNGDTGLKSLREQLMRMLKKLQLKHVVIVGIYGFASNEGEGIGDLLDHLQERLKHEDGINSIPDRNFLTMAWHEPSGRADSAPDTQRHKDTMANVTSTPSYVALIGHSLGGWSVAKVSRNMPWHDYPLADFVGLIDPVFGPLGDTEPRVNPYGKTIKNWYQRNAITVTNAEHCAGALLPTNNCNGPFRAGISCGRSLDSDSVENIEVTFEKNEDGGEKKIHCVIHLPGLPPIRYEKPRFIAHDTIDNDEHIREQIETKIISDLLKLVESLHSL